MLSDKAPNITASRLGMFDLFMEWLFCDADHVSSEFGEAFLPIDRQHRASEDVGEIGRILKDFAAFLARDRGFVAIAEQWASQWTRRPDPSAVVAEAVTRARCAILMKLLRQQLTELDDILTPNLPRSVCYPDDLTNRETEVLRELASGMSKREIAESLDISINTVGTHVKNVYSKTGCSNRAEATRLATERGLVHESVRAHPNHAFRGQKITRWHHLNG